MHAIVPFIKTESVLRIKTISGAFYKISHSVVVYLNCIADLRSWLCPTLLRRILAKNKDFRNRRNSDIKFKESSCCSFSIEVSSILEKIIPFKPLLLPSRSQHALPFDFEKLEPTSSSYSTTE